MKKQDVSSKKLSINLDAALEEVAKKLRPAANMPACGNTNLSNTRFTAFYNCSCCSEVSECPTSGRQEICVPC
jgi:hypothetical protein